MGAVFDKVWMGIIIFISDWSVGWVIYFLKHNVLCLVCITTATKWTKLIIMFFQKQA